MGAMRAESPKHSMLFRIFYGNTYKDIAGSGLTKFTIGSGKNDTVSIPDSSLKKAHVTVSFVKGEWVAVSKEPIFYGQKDVSTAALRLNTALGISEAEHIFVFLFSEPPTRPVTIGIGDVEEITVGSSSDNSIAIRSHFISGHPHHLIFKKSGTGFLLTDTDSTNGTYIDGKRVSSCILNAPCEIVLGDARIIFRGKALEIYYERDRVQIQGLQKNKRDYHTSVIYKRSPRLKINAPIQSVEIERPPTIGGKPEINWVSTLLPVVSTIGIAIVLTTVMSSPMMLVYSLPMTFVGLIISLTNHSKQKKRYMLQQKLRLDKYTEHLDQAVQAIEHCQREQIRAMEAADPDLNTCLSIADSLDSRLWQRRSVDSDFMSVRLGSGEVESAADIHFTKVSLSLEEDELAGQPQHIYDKYHLLGGAPITCDILKGQVCGIVGRHEDAVRLLDQILVQIATHHCYTDVKTVLICDKNDWDRVNWTCKLPHTYTEDESGRLIATTKSEAVELFKDFADILKGRKYLRDADDNYGTPKLMLPYFLFILLQPTFLDKSNPINDYLLRTKNLSAGMIMVVEDVAQLPPECNIIIDISGNKGEVYSKENASLKRTFFVDSCEPRSFERFGEMLEHVTCEAESQGNVLPKSFSFYEMMGISDIRQWDISARWKQSNVIETMATPIGISESGEIASLDLHEKGHGPHGIVAGTTGSGKSEALISYILSMAMNYHPHEVGFVIIDFKGGGMVNQLINLPHLIGTITDIDDNGIDRSLASIKAEINRRKQVFAENNLKDNTITEYIREYKAGKVKVPLPHLIIIVDEFAELKQNQPEFMKELVSASRVGRSLGIHLVLATQQPQGQVSGEIWTNSRFQISLRAASAEDSNEVIKSPLAFSIRTPGRLYLRVGNNEIFELIQSAYSKELADNGKLQFEEVIEHISNHCHSSGIKKVASIYHPPLPNILNYKNPVKLKCGNCSQGIVSCIGMYDDPSCQDQGDLTINISQENVLIIGSSQRGKTNLLQTIIRDVAQRYTPEMVNLYIIDFASMILGNFSELNHVGGVVTVNEDEKLENLFKLLTVEIENRKQVFSQKRVSSFSAYIDAGFNDLPQIILFIDNFTVMQELYSDECDQLLGISREGPTAGISVVMANSQMNGLTKYKSNFPRKIALYCNDSSEYSSLIEGNRSKLHDIPGRALTEVDRQIVELQVFLSFDGEREIDRVNKMHQFVTECNLQSGGLRARTIPMVPELLTIDTMRQSGFATNAVNYRIPMGLNYSNVEVVYLDLLRQGILAISGAEQSGKTNLVKHIISTIQDRIFDNTTLVYLVDGSRSLQDICEFACVAEVANNLSEAESMIESVHSQLIERKNLADSGEDLPVDAPLLMLVLTGEELVAQLLHNQRICDKLQSIAKELRRYKGFVLIEGVENIPINYASPAILKFLKDTHSFYVFENISDIGLFDIPIKITQKYSKRIRQGDAFSFVGGKVMRVRTILNRIDGEV